LSRKDQILVLSPENIVFILKKAEGTTILIQSTKGEKKRIFRRLSSEGHPRREKRREYLGDYPPRASLQEE
jgi:hypothetical protein